MKPSLRADLTSILAIGAGAFVSGLLTAVMVVRTSTHDAAYTVEVSADPNVEVHWEAQAHGTPTHIRLESSHRRIIVHRQR